MRPPSEAANVLRTSFWFVPGAMALAAGALAVAAVAFDHISPWPTRAGSGEGAQRLLSTLAGSIITVTGVVFSLTILTLHLASAQYGPQLLRSFMRDRGHQVVLGTFVATFVFCVTALVAEPGPAGLAVGVALVLTAASVAALIYFIHHLAVAIQPGTVVADVAKQLMHQIGRLYPDETEEHLRLPDKRPQVLEAQRDGYVVWIDPEGLLETAKEHRATLQVLVRPGQFVTVGAPIIHAWPAAPESITRQVAVGSRRTENEDIEFSIHQLTEMAVRALSPSINEPFTALVCIDYLAAEYRRLARRDTSPRIHRSGEGVVAVPRASFKQMLDAGFGVIRQYADSPLARQRLLEALARVAQRCQEPRRLAAVREHAAAIMDGARKAAHSPVDMGRLERAHQAVLGGLEVRVAR